MPFSWSKRKMKKKKCVIVIKKIFIYIFCCVLSHIWVDVCVLYIVLWKYSSSNIHACIIIKVKGWKAFYQNALLLLWNPRQHSFSLKIYIFNKNIVGGSSDSSNVDEGELFFSLHFCPHKYAIFLYYFCWLIFYFFFFSTFSVLR